MTGAFEVLAVVLTLASKAQAISDAPVAFVNGDGSLSFPKQALLRSSQFTKVAGQKSVVLDEISENFSKTISNTDNSKKSKVAPDEAVQEEPRNKVTNKVTAPIEACSAQDFIKIQEELAAARFEIATLRKAMENGKGSLALASTESKQNSPSDELLSSRQESRSNTGDTRSGWSCPWNCAEYRSSMDYYKSQMEHYKEQTDFWQSQAFFFRKRCFDGLCVKGEHI